VSLTRVMGEIRSCELTCQKIYISNR
jgi:hypothetical protein